MPRSIPTVFLALAVTTVGTAAPLDAPTVPDTRTRVDSPIARADRVTAWDDFDATAIEIDAAMRAVVRMQPFDVPFVIEGLPLGAEHAVDLAVRRVDPWFEAPTVLRATRHADGSVTNTPIALPDVDVLAGSIDGLPGSQAIITIGEAGIHGLVQDGTRTWFLSSGPFGGDQPALAFEPALLPEEAVRLAPIACQVLEARDAIEIEGGVAGGGDPCRAIALAIDTDVEFTDGLFGGNTGASGAYAASLVGAMSAIYEDQLSIRMGMSWLRLWTGEDIWTGGSTGARLNEFQDHFENDIVGVPRDLAHFFSGAGLGGGIAYLNALCSAGSGYAVSANLNGFYPFPIVDNSGQNWDLYVTTHEAGHNLGTGHTHSYSPPIDDCAGGDCSVTPAGTIMSYCHLCPGGVSNIQLRFAPRVQDRIREFVGSIPCDFTAPGDGPVPVADRYAFVTDSIEMDLVANELDVNCDEITLGFLPSETDAGGTLTRLVGVGPDGRDLVRYDPPADFVGEDAFRYRIVQVSTGAQTFSPVVIEVVRPLPAVTVVGDEPGLLAEWYEVGKIGLLPDFDALEAYGEDIVPRVAASSSNGEFMTSGRADSVAARFTAWIEVPADGVWRLSIESDDGSRLFLGDELLVDNDGLHGMRDRSGLILLEAGTHPIRIEFFENFGGAGLIARWEGPGVERDVIPASAWSFGGTIDTLNPDLDGDGVVNGADLAVLLGNWAGSGVGDLDGNGQVDGADLAIMLGSWS